MSLARNWIRSTGTNGADGGYIEQFEGIRGPPNPAASMPRLYPEASHDYSSESSEDDHMKDETGSEDTATEVGNSPLHFSEDVEGG